MSFKKSKGVGRKGERKVFDLLNSLGFECEFDTDHKKNKWDLVFEYGSEKVTIEVKNDLMSCLTGNIAIEVHNPKKNVASGLMCTDATLWIHIVPNRAIYIARVDKLKDFVKSSPFMKFFSAGGDQNADLILYKKDMIVGKGLFLFPEDDTKITLCVLEKLLENRNVE